MPINPSDVRTLLAGMDFHPSKALGQNFLVDRNVRDIIIVQSDVSSDDTILEIGPGLGAVTEELVCRAGLVIAVEKDRKLHAALLECLAGKDNIDLVCSDALKLDFDSLLKKHGVGRFKVVSNLPYSVGNRIIVDLLRMPRRPETMVVTVQKEVADRYAARPGTSDYGKLSVWIQQVYDVKTVRTISQTCFWPVPEVSSALVKMTRHERLPLGESGVKVFNDLTNRAFTFRRKQIGTTVSGAYPAAVSQLGAAGIDPKTRPEDIPVEKWVELARLMEGILKG